MYIRFFKRFLDVIFAILTMPVVLIVIIISAIIIKLEDGGSIFYIAKRIGKNGNLFRMFKLRTMFENAPDIRLEDGSTYNADDDPRVTKFGRFARKTSIDELPQIINVLIGDMSFIGPRPDPPDWIDKYPIEIRKFLSIRPGITGYNQAYFRNKADGQEKMKNDYYYYKNISFALDCKIFFKTIITVLKKENTYKSNSNSYNDRTYEIGSEFDYYSNGELLNQNINNISKNTYYYQSGRDALKAIAKKYANEHRKVLLPALCCNSMVSPFEKYNYDVDYYILNKDCSINLPDLNKKITDNSLFLFINYFGNKAINDFNLKLIKNKSPNIIIIEDKTHDFLVNKNDKFRDYIVISIRKWFAIPDGGIVITNNKLDSVPSNKKFTKIRLDGLKTKSKYLKTKNLDFKDKFLKLFKNANDELDLYKDPHEMSRISKDIYSHIDFKKMKILRRRNIKYLYDNLKTNKNIELLFKNDPKDSLYFPILVENRDKVQKELAKNGVYCPVIWPIPEKANKICKISSKISEKILAIPCDQRYKKEDMEYIIKSINLIGK